MKKRSEASIHPAKKSPQRAGASVQNRNFNGSCRWDWVETVTKTVRCPIPESFVAFALFFFPFDWHSEANGNERRKTGVQRSASNNSNGSRSFPLYHLIVPDVRSSAEKLQDICTVGFWRKIRHNRDIMATEFRAVGRNWTAVLFAHIRLMWTASLRSLCYLCSGSCADSGNSFFQTSDTWVIQITAKAWISKSVDLLRGHFHCNRFSDNSDNRIFFELVIEYPIWK